ncbi:MAG TPA: histidine--tRNA ligase [Acidimicrobiales bacterium]|nr:histidine--tRNA ligase [Acidimicrobiales bacterium]
MANETTGTAALRAPSGTHDVLWPESSRWEALLGLFAGRARRAGFGLTLTPMFEDARLFHRGIGDDSDVVNKEMYEFTDRGGRAVALRPEGTASVVRAFVQHHPPTPWKAWYATPAFRYERPQAGRYRQHHQLGVEVLGTEDPDLDVEVVALAAGFYRDLGLERIELAVNSMGCAEDRPRYVAALRDFLAEHIAELCDEHRERLAGGTLVNALRVLDCKRPPCRAATEGAPRLVDFLDDACAGHFARVLAGLEALGIAHRLEPRLVRGLDYYTRTTFEFAGLALDSAQNAVGGGGRYDGLAEAIGGPATSGIGFGIGVERLLLACDAEGCFAVSPAAADAFVIDLTDGSEARDLVDELRRAGLVALRAYDGRSPKSQMKQADKSGARFAVIIGDEEVSGGVVTLRPLRDDGEQQTVPRPDIVARLTQLSEQADQSEQAGQPGPSRRSDEG